MALTDKLTAIADATRAKTGTTNQMTLDEIATAINGISSGGNIEVKSFVPTQAANVNTVTFDLTNYINNIQDEFVMVYTYSHTSNSTKIYYIAVVKINKADNSVSELSTFRMGQSSNTPAPQASNYQFINNKLTINFRNAVTIYPSSSIQKTYYSPEIYIIGISK